LTAEVSTTAAEFPRGGGAVERVVVVRAGIAVD